MKSACAALALALALSVLLLPLAAAAEYGNYDIQLALRQADTPEGKRYSVNGKYLDQMLTDLGTHAKNYPPKFASEAERQRAIRDAQALAGVFDVLLKMPKPQPDALLRAGFLHSLSYNLKIPGSSEKTTAVFKQLFAMAPAHPQGNYVYGAFLAGASRPKEALPYLKTAHAGGVIEAPYALGMTHLALGNRKQALEFLEIYQARVPTDENVGKLISGVRSGKLEIKTERTGTP